jgi:hypothetical protein
MLQCMLRNATVLSLLECRPQVIIKIPNDQSIDHLQCLSYVHKEAHLLQLYATRWKVAGSIPDEVIGFFQLT